MRKKFLGIPVILLVLAAVSLVAGVVLAAVAHPYHGSVQIGSGGGTGGGGGGGVPNPNYAFAEFSDADAQIALTDGYWSFGIMNKDSYYDRPVWVKNTGNQALSVSASVSWNGTALGTFTGLDAVAVPVGQVVQMPIRFISGNVTGAMTGFDITFTESH